MVAGMFSLYVNLKKNLHQTPFESWSTTLLDVSGQRPSEAKVQQVYRQIVTQQKSALAKNKKKIRVGQSHDNKWEGLENFLVPPLKKNMDNRLVFRFW